MTSVLRILFLALLLPALMAPQGLALAWCLCSGAPEGCCAEAPDRCCEGDDGACGAADCSDCGELEVDAPEPLLVAADLPWGAVLALWGGEPAAFALVAPALAPAAPGPAPPLERVQAGRGSGVLPLRI